MTVAFIDADERNLAAARETLVRLDMSLGGLSTGDTAQLYKLVPPPDSFTGELPRLSCATTHDQLLQWKTCC